MTATPAFGRVLSVSDAAARGVPGLVKDAEHGGDVIVARHGRPVAAVVGMRRLEQLRELELELRDVALVLARAATDTGVRTGLDEAIAAFGFNRADLAADLAAERD
jgi:prevent-host-death family protein